MTKRAADGLGICRAARYVFVKVKDAYQLFQVERYANGGKSLLAFVVQGSMQEGAKRKKGPLVVLDAAVARLGPYLPVYCHGFDGKESHLNGMIGLVDVHPILSHPMYSVQFDSATIGTREVRFDNLRILFDVPVESSVDLKRKELDVARSRDAPTAAVSLTQLQSEEKKRLVAHFQPQIEELRSKIQMKKACSKSESAGLRVYWPRGQKSACYKRSRLNFGGRSNPLLKMATNAT